MVGRGRWVVLLALASCSDPIITEDTARGCRNRYDDDGDGLVDCADPSCIASGVCETGETACRNGADDDGDGRTDCQQTACVEGGYCDSAVATCAPTPQAGCLAGMGCYVTLDGTTGAVVSRCRRAGVGTVGDSCNATTIAALAPRDSHPCVAGAGCSVVGSDQGVCASYCTSDDDCLPGGMCLPATRPPDRPGSCTQPCNPISLLGCNGMSLACRSFAEFRKSKFAEGKTRFQCVPMSSRTDQTAVRSPCDNPAPASSPVSRVCGSGAVCVPTVPGPGAVCRASCDVNGASCPGGARCNALYGSGRAPMFGSIALGYCL